MDVTVPLFLRQCSTITLGEALLTVAATTLVYRNILFLKAAQRPQRPRPAALVLQASVGCSIAAPINDQEGAEAFGISALAPL